MIKKIFNFLLKDETYIKVKKIEYDLMKKMVERQDNFAIQLMAQTKEIEKLKEILNTKKIETRKIIGKVGGMQKQINILNKKNNILLNENEELIIKIEGLNKTISFKNLEIEMLRNKGKRKKDVESYKNYFQARKELEKREKDGKNL